MVIEKIKIADYSCCFPTGRCRGFVLGFQNDFFKIF